MGKKQKWFFRDAKQILEKLQGDTREELERRQWQLLFTVSDSLGVIQWWVERYDDSEINKSTLQIRNIVDFDIAIEDFREWMKDPKPMKVKTSTTIEELGIIERFLKMIGVPKTHKPKKNKKTKKKKKEKKTTNKKQGLD